MVLNPSVKHFRHSSQISLSWRKIIILVPSTERPQCVIVPLNNGRFLLKSAKFVSQKVECMKLWKWLPLKVTVELNLLICLLFSVELEFLKIVEDNFCSDEFPLVFILLIQSYFFIGNFSNKLIVLKSQFFKVVNEKISLWLELNICWVNINIL